MKTVFEILKQSDLIREELQLDAVVVVLDQALYAKATEIAWKQKERFCGIILRMGTFHTICNALAIIGKRFQDGGLKDICIEAGLVAEGSINGVMDGKHYNRAVRTHKIIYEAMMRLVWTEFTHQLETNNPEKSDLINSILDQVTNLASDLNQETFSSVLKSPFLSELVTMWQDFLEHLRHSNGELSTYWMSYIDLVEEVVLGLLRASREGNWHLHLHAIRAFLPWCFAYDRVNYARYLSTYFAEMTNLPQKNPEVYEAFQCGMFSVQLSSNNPFGKIPVDQTTEVTVNKDTQTPGGTSGFSLKAGAIKRYYMTAEHRSAFLGQLRDMIQGNLSQLQHTELQQSRIKTDEEAVTATVSLIQGWVNPFAGSQEIISISTAKVAPKDIASDLMRAYEVGEKSYAAFKEERLEPHTPAKKFHDPLKANKLKTFSAMCKKKEVKASGCTIILKADRSLFGRIIVMAQSRSLQMENVLSHPLGPLPWALSTPDGLLRKTNKAALATSLQKNVSVAEKLPENTASVIDGMNLVQRVKGDEACFGDVAKIVFSMALSEGRQSSRIDVVFDTYKDNSIKNCERSLRGEETGHHLQSITDTQLVRKWRSFLAKVTNKTNLILFLVNEWRKSKYRKELREKVLYVTAGEECFRITAEGSELFPTLQCQQEEADGRLLLHANHAAEKGFHAVIICSEDTDVFIMSLAFRDKIKAPIFQKCGTIGRTKLIDINKVAASVGIDVCHALVGMHAYTGCDTVSAFAGKGKASALKYLTTDQEVQGTFRDLGKEWDVSSELMEKLETFTCRIYSPKAAVTKINDLRYRLFCAKRGDIESHQLPPCRDCLEKHAQRANYQAAIWRRCLEKDPQAPSPVGHGWKTETVAGVEQLVVHWMDGQPAPEALLDLLACNCPKHCVSNKCVCLANGLKCTDMCRQPDCENQASISDTDESDDDDEEEED